MPESSRWLMRGLDRRSDPSLDPVPGDEAVVEFEPEPRSRGNRVGAVGDRWSILDDVPEDRVPVGVKTLHVSAVRDGGEEVGRDLRFLVVGHLDAEDLRRCGGTAPFRWPSAPGRVEVAHVDGALDHGVAGGGGPYLAPGGRDGDARYARTPSLGGTFVLLTS